MIFIGEKIKSNKFNTRPSFHMWICVWEGGLKTFMYFCLVKKAWAKWWSHLYSHIFTDLIKLFCKVCQQKADMQDKTLRKPMPNNCPSHKKKINLPSAFRPTNIIKSCKSKSQGKKQLLLCIIYIIYQQAAEIISSLQFNS